jgi:hypothetical protein
MRTEGGTFSAGLPLTRRDQRNLAHTRGTVYLH